MRTLSLLLAMITLSTSRAPEKLEVESSLESKLSKHQLVMDERTAILLDGKRVTLEYFTNNSERVTIVEIEIARDGITVLRIVATTERK